MSPERLDGTLFGSEQPCFGCSTTHPHGFHLQFSRDSEGVTTRFVPGELHQGPPGIMHGGLVMTLADEVAAWAIVAKLGKFGFTASFEGKFKSPVRVGNEVLGHGRIVKESPRVVRVHVRLVQAGVECFEGTLAFVLLDRAASEKLLQRPLPEAWQRFAR